MHWAKNPIFRGIDLTDSFVLSWHTSDSQLVFDLEASVWPDSPHYEQPLPDEHTCYKRAALVFAGFTTISGLRDMHQIKPAINADGSQDYGSIDHLEDTGVGFHVSGEFGSVAISGGTMQFAVTEAV